MTFPPYFFARGSEPLANYPQILSRYNLEGSYTVPIQAFAITVLFLPVPITAPLCLCYTPQVDSY